MKKLIIMLLFTTNVFANVCDQNPIFCHILDISPGINKQLAFQISNKISKYSRKYGLDAKLFVAIIRQESNFKLDAKGCVEGLNVDFEEIRVCNDFGMIQLNYRTAKLYGFDIQRTMIDLDYSIFVGMKILYDFKVRYAKKEEFWWTRYNAKDEIKRELYRKLVMRYYK